MFIDFGHILKKMPLASVERSRLLSCFQILIAVTLLVGVGVMYVSTVRSAHSAAASDLVVRGKIVSSIVARAAAQTLDRASAEDANAALERVIYDIRAEQGLEFAFIVDRGHRAIAHSETSQAGTILDVGLDTADKAEAHRGWTEDGFYYTARPANESTARAGTSGTLYEFVHPVRLGARAKERYLGDLELHLAFVLPPWSSFAKSSIKLIAPGLAIAFMLLIVGNYAAGVLVRPLGNLRRGTAAAAKELDNCVLEVNGRGDVVEIARNWNDMVGNFRTSHESTTEARRELEVRNRVMLYE